MTKTLKQQHNKTLTIYTHSADLYFPEETIQYKTILKNTLESQQTARMIVSRAVCRGDHKAFWRVD